MIKEIVDQIDLKLQKLGNLNQGAIEDRMILKAEIRTLVWVLTLKQ